MYLYTAVQMQQSNIIIEQPYVCSYIFTIYIV